MVLLQKELKNAYIGEYAKYQEVEYIESSGTQYINTNLFPENKHQVETKIEVNSTSQDIAVFGCELNNSTDSSWGTYYHLTPYNNKWYYGLNGSEANVGTYSPVVGTQYTIIYNNSSSKITINGTDYGNTTGTVGLSGSKLTISYRGNTGGNNGRKFGKFKYFYFRVYDKTAGAYVRNFIPCYRKSDGVIGMYDLVNKQFYTNSGTGTFTKGPDVN